MTFWSVFSSKPFLVDFFRDSQVAASGTCRKMGKWKRNRNLLGAFRDFQKVLVHFSPFSKSASGWLPGQRASGPQGGGTFGAENGGGEATKEGRTGQETTKRTSKKNTKSATRNLEKARNNQKRLLPSWKVVEEPVALPETGARGPGGLGGLELWGWFRLMVFSCSFCFFLRTSFHHFLFFFLFTSNFSFFLVSLSWAFYL